MTLPDWMRSPGPEICPAAEGKGRSGFIEKSLGRFGSVLKETLASEMYASRGGFLQGLEPRSKIAGFFLLIIAAALFESWLFILIVFALTIGLSMATKVGAGPLLKRALPAIIFTAVLAVPACLSFITPGRELFGIGSVAITAEGVKTALFFVLRVSAMASLAALAVLTTRQADFFKGLGSLVPNFFVAALFFTFRYVLILVKVAEDAALARKSRTMDRASLNEAQRWFASRAALILKRSLNTAEEVSMAMVSRGFDGKVRSFSAAPPGPPEFIWLGATSFVLFLSFGF